MITKIQGRKWLLQNLREIWNKYANTPKDNFYFKDNPFNCLFDDQNLEHQTLDSSQKVGEEALILGDMKEISPKMPMINGWTKSSKAKIGKEDKENLFKPITKYSHYLLDKDKRISQSGKSTSLINNFKSNIKDIKRGHKSSKSAYDGTKAFEPKIESTKFKVFEGDIINKQK